MPIPTTGLNILPASKTEKNELKCIKVQVEATNCNLQIEDFAAALIFEICDDEPEKIISACVYNKALKEEVAWDIQGFDESESEYAHKILFDFLEKYGAQSYLYNLMVKSKENLFGREKSFRLNQVSLGDNSIA